ncbi:zinc knuckle CX2CX4HX4C containing protein [Tanacetum coccineum]
MEQVLERGSWMICKSPIILNKWSPSLSLKKGEVTKVPVWVKMHNVPLLAYSDVGLSLIATQIDMALYMPEACKEAAPKAPSMVANKPSPMEDQEEGFVELSNSSEILTGFVSSSKVSWSILMYDDIRISFVGCSSYARRLGYDAYVGWLTDMTETKYHIQAQLFQVSWSYSESYLRMKIKEIAVNSQYFLLHLCTQVRFDCNRCLNYVDS